jgi:hypothetical protein
MGHTDAAKRVSDVSVMHWAALEWESVHKWMAWRLDTGISDNNLYVSKSEAIRAQKGDEFLYMYLPQHPGGMHVCEAEIMLTLHRKAYDNGFRLVDPDSKNGGRGIIPRISTADVSDQVRALS